MMEFNVGFWTIDFKLFMLFMLIGICSIQTNGEHSIRYVTANRSMIVMIFHRNSAMRKLRIYPKVGD